MPSYKSSNFSITKGDKKTISITVKDPDGDAIDLTGYEARFTIRSEPGSSSYILRKATDGIGGGADAQMNITSPTTGVVQVYILKTDLITRATCTVTTVAAADLVNDEGFTLYDTFNNAVVFKFNKDGGGVTGADVTIVVTTGETASQVGALIQAGVDGHAAFSASNVDEVVTVTQQVPGATTSITDNSDTVADGTFAVTAFSGGLDTPNAGNYQYEVEVIDSGSNPYTVVQAYVTIKDQLGDWEDIS